MIFRLAKLEEKDILLNMYNNDRNKSYTAWDDTYPTMELIIDNINGNNLFILEDNNEIIGSIAINNENELDTEATFSNPKALEFGRVIINPSYRGNGYANLLIDNIEKEIKNRGYNAVHICVYVNSTIALSMYKKHNYKEVITKELFEYATFVLMEKEI